MELMGLFYEAQIGWDAIIGYTTLARWKVGILPGKGCLVGEQAHPPGGIVYLEGLKKFPQNLVDSPLIGRGSNDFKSARGNMMTISQKQKWVTCDYAVTEDLVKKIVERFGTPTLDAFASEKNRRFSRFWSEKNSAWTKNWKNHGLLWINPPYDEMERVVAKIVEDKAEAILIVPQWDTHPWWPRVMNLVTDR
jgi:hypothetical protein